MDTCVACLRSCHHVLNYRCAAFITSDSTGAAVYSGTGKCAKQEILTNCEPGCAMYRGCQAGPVPPAAASVCVIWGDPHTVTFDKATASYYTAGEYWIVKSQTVWIQGLYRATHATSGLSVMKQIGFGGPFLKGNKLIVGPTQAWYNGQLVLPQLGSSLNNGLIQAKYDNIGASMQQGRQGMQLKVVHLSLPLNVNVQINRWQQPSEGNYINAKISMTPQPDQDGHCGNFNGDPADDARVQVRARIGTNGVAQPDMIFPGPKTPINPVPGRPDINNVPKDKLEKAKVICKAKEHKFIPSMQCLIDVSYGGAGFAGEGAASGN